VYISHFLEEVKEISDRYTVLRDGKSVGGGATAGATTSQIIALMVGRQVEDLYPRSRRPIGEVILEVTSLSGEADNVASALREAEESGRVIQQQRQRFLSVNPTAAGLVWKDRVSSA